MALLLRQSTAVDVLIGPFLDLTDASTAETGESPSVKLSKNGQALAAKNDATTPVHDADGYYNCELDATDTNTVGTLVLTVAASASALPVRHEFQVVEEAIYDAFYAGSATGLLPANVTQISGDATAADNLEAALDGTGGVAITATFTGNLTGSVASVTGNVGGTVNELGTQAKADVNAEVLDVLNTDTFAEPTGVPGATISLADKIGFLFMEQRNQVTVTASKMTVHDDGGSGEYEYDVSDNGTTFTKSEANAI